MRLVDLVVETPRNKIIGIEIKSKPLPQELDFASGQKALRAVAPKAEFFCACTGNTKRIVGDGKVWPYQEVLKMLQESE